MKTRQARVAVAAGLAAVCGIVMAAPAAAIELDNVTVVTLARDGSWGVATAGATGEAIAAALRSCRAMAGMTGAPTDCGAQSVSTRGGWVVADLCGDHQIIVSAATREGAEIAAQESPVASCARLAALPARADRRSRRRHRRRRGAPYRRRRG